LFFIFGGADNTGNMNDIQILDTVKNTWTTAAVSGTPPSPRTFHTNSIIGDRLVVYSGGHTQAEPVPDRQVYFFDTVSMSWSTKVIKGDAPKPRHGHVMVAIGDNQLYLHGGMARSSFFDDFHCLDLTKNSWSHIKNKKMYPTARAGHSGTAAGTMLFIYGGMNRDGALDDLYRYDTSKTKVVVSLCFLKEVGISHLTFKGHAMLVFPLGQKKSNIFFYMKNL